MRSFYLERSNYKISNFYLKIVITIYHGISRAIVHPAYSPAFFFFFYVTSVNFYERKWMINSNFFLHELWTHKYALPLFPNLLSSRVSAPWSDVSCQACFSDRTSRLTNFASRVNVSLRCEKLLSVSSRRWSFSHPRNQLRPS